MERPSHLQASFPDLDVGEIWCSFLGQSIAFADLREGGFNQAQAIKDSQRAVAAPRNSPLQEKYPIRAALGTRAGTRILRTFAFPRPPRCPSCRRSPDFGHAHKPIAKRDR